MDNVTRLDDYNRRFSGDRPVWLTSLELIRFLVERVLFRHPSAYSVSSTQPYWNEWINAHVQVCRIIHFQFFYKLNFRLRVILIFIAVIVYTLMPLDIFPEGAYGVVGTFYE